MDNPYVLIGLWIVLRAFIYYVLPLMVVLTAVIVIGYRLLRRQWLSLDKILLIFVLSMFVVLAGFRVVGFIRERVNRAQDAQHQQQLKDFRTRQNEEYINKLLAQPVTFYIADDLPPGIRLDYEQFQTDSIDQEYVSDHRRVVTIQREIIGSTEAEGGCMYVTKSEVVKFLTLDCTEEKIGSLSLYKRSQQSGEYLLVSGKSGIFIRVQSEAPAEGHVDVSSADDDALVRAIAAAMKPMRKETIKARFYQNAR